MFQGRGLKKTTQKSKEKSKQTKTWRKWTEEEKKALQRAFCHNIIRGVGAQKVDILRAQENFPILNGRQIPQISSQVNNMIKKRNKQPEN